MKRNLKRIVIWSMALFSIICYPVPVHAEKTILYSTEDDKRSQEIIWKYKMINGKLYKRQFNTVTGKWIGNWIPA